MPSPNRRNSAVSARLSRKENLSPGRSTGVGRAGGIVRFATGGGAQRESDFSWRMNAVGRGDGIIRVATGGGSQRGFTLIEVLLATVLLAAGLALGFATLRAATATANRGEAIAARSERMRAVEGFLRRRLSSALPIAFQTEPDTGRAIRFLGESQRVRFVADLPDYLGRGGPHLHDIGVVDIDGGEALAASFAMVLAGETVEERDPRPPEPLAGDVASVRFRYRGLDSQHRLTDWLDKWEYADILPLQVSVDIETVSGGRWPTLVVMLPQGGAATIQEPLP